MAAQEGFLGMTKTAQVAIFFAFVALVRTHTFKQHRAGGTGYILVPATALIYMSKVAGAFGMHMVKADGDVKCSACHDSGAFQQLAKSPSQLICLHSTTCFHSSLSPRWTQ
jgi:hypothetical protein